MKHNRYSDLKIVGFPDKIESFRSGVITAPIYVRVKPTNRCNHGCRFCTYSDGTKRPKDSATDHLQSAMHEDMNERDSIPISKLMETLDEFRRIGVKAVTFSGGGEPLFYPDIVEAMERTLANGLALSIITNGQLLNSERTGILRNAAWVRVSIDYTTPGQMSASRHVGEQCFDGVIENLSKFASLKCEQCDLGVNFIVTRYNCNGLVPFAALLKSIGVQNVRFSPVYVDGFQEYHRPIADSVGEQLAEIQSMCDDWFSVNSTYDINSDSKKKERPFKRCLYMQTVPVIGADQNVYACHNQAYSRDGLIGSIKDQTFSDLWYSDAAKRVFESLDPSVSCRKECANHNKVALFNSLAASGSDPFV